MGSLGNLSFEVLFRSDPEQLEKIKKQALEQLKDLEVKFNMSASISKEDIAKQIRETLEKEHKVNVSVDKEKLSTEVREAVSKTESGQEVQSITNQAEAYRDLESAINSIIGARGANIQRLVAEKAELEKVQSQLRLIKKQQENGIILNKDQVKQKKDLINKELEHKQAIAELNQVIKSDIKNSQATVTSMDGISQSLGRMKMAYRQLTESERESPFGKKLLAQITATDKKIKELDATIGNHQRNVGNYKKGFDGLQYEVNMLVREMPAIAYGPQAFFGAISNNFPMFLDQMRKAKLEYKSLIEAQKNGMRMNEVAVPSWKRLIGAVVNWQTAIVVGITLLVMHGRKISEWIGNLFKAKNSIELTREELKKLNEEFANTAGRELVQLDTMFDRLRKAKEGTAEWNDARAAIINQHGDILSGMNQEIVSLNDQAGAYRALRDEIYEVAKAKAISAVRDKYEAETISKTADNYTRIYNEAAATRGREYADDLISRIRHDIEVVGELSSELNNEIKEVFRPSGYVAQSTAGASISSDTNEVLYAVNEIINAQNLLENKMKQAEDNFSWLKVPPEVVKQNKAYWQSQLNAAQKYFDGLDETLEGTEEWDNALANIAEYQEKIALWTIKESKSASKTNDPYRERLSILKDMNSEYRAWAAIVGEDRAVNVVRDIFETPDFDPATYRDDLMKILNSATDTSVKVDAAKTLSGLDKESIEEALKETEKYISDTVKGWDLFSDLFKESKDYNFSINAAFGGNVAFKSVLEQLEADIRKALEGNRQGITFDEIIKLDPSKAGRRFDGQMAAYVKAYQEQSKKISDESLKNSAKLLKTYRDYEDQRKDIIAKGEQEVADLIANGASAQVIEMANEATSKALNKLQDDVLNKYGLGDYAAKGNVSDLFKNRIRESLPLFKNISSATLSELNKAKEVVGSMKIPPQLLVDFKKAGGDAEKLAEIIKEAQDNANEALDDRMLNKIVDSVNKLTNSIGKLGGALQKFDNKNLKGIGEFFESVSGGMGDILEFAKLGKNATKMDVISLGISGVATIIDTATTAINKNIEAQKEWSEAIEDSLQKMRMYNIEQLAYKQNSIFGMDSPIAPAISAIKQYEKSVESLLEIEKKLGEGLVQTGSKKVPSGSAVGGFVVGGAALGGAIGSIVPVIGTALGAVIGGLLGGLAAGIGSLFGSKATTKTVPIFESLKDHYGELFDTKTFELNPKILADYEKMDEETKKIIDNWDEIRQAMIEANEQIEETLKNIAGSIGEDLYSALINAFRNKDLTAALNEFKSSVNKILSDLAARMLFNAVFSETLKKGEERMRKSLDPGGDQDLTDDIDWLGDELEKGMPVFLEGLEGLKKMFKGFDRELDFGDSDTGGGLSAGIKGITEDTASLLASYANSMRADGAKRNEILLRLVDNQFPEMNAMAKAQLVHLANIATYTSRNADAAEEILDYLSRAWNPSIRGFKVG